jgi:hypothetical protein
VVPSAGGVAGGVPFATGGGGGGGAASRVAMLFTARSARLT